MKYTLLITLIYLFTTVTNYTQDLSHHKWQDRVILLLSADSSGEMAERQLAELKNSENGLTERKLVIYSVFPGGYKTVFPDTSVWNSTESLYNSYKQSDSPFELVLIGLDGGVKLRESEYQTSDEIFSVIDKMYMRRKEIENNRNN